MISVAGSIQSHGGDTARSEEKKETESPEKVTPKPENAGFLRGFGAMFGFGGKDAKGANLSREAIEFPWTKYLIEEDVIKRWSAVDMKQVYHLHANFDIEQAQFVNIDLEEVSMAPSQQVPII